MPFKNDGKVHVHSAIMLHRPHHYVGVHANNADEANQFFNKFKKIFFIKYFNIYFSKPLRLLGDLLLMQ